MLDALLIGCNIDGMCASFPPMFLLTSNVPDNPLKIINGLLYVLFCPITMSGNLVMK